MNIAIPLPCTAAATVKQDYGNKHVAIEEWKLLGSCTYECLHSVHVVHSLDKVSLLQESTFLQ